MKYLKTKKMYKNSSGSNEFYPESMTAYSYGWWQYLKSFDGVIVFNDYHYSPTTCGHKGKLRSLLIELGYDINKFVYIEAPKGLQDLPSAVRHYDSKIKNLEALIAKKGTRKSTNERRAAEIADYKAKIAFIQKLIARQDLDSVAYSLSN